MRYVWPYSQLAYNPCSIYMYAICFTRVGYISSSASCYLYNVGRREDPHDLRPLTWSHVLDRVNYRVQSNVGVVFDQAAINNSKKQNYPKAVTISMQTTRCYSAGNQRLHRCWPLANKVNNIDQRQIWPRKLPLPLGGCGSYHLFYFRRADICNITLYSTFIIFPQVRTSEIKTNIS